MLFIFLSLYIFWWLGLGFSTNVLDFLSLFRTDVHMNVETNIEDGNLENSEKLKITFWVDKNLSKVIILSAILDGSHY